MSRATTKTKIETPVEPELKPVVVVEIVEHVDAEPELNAQTLAEQAAGRETLARYAQK